MEVWGRWAGRALGPKQGLGGGGGTMGCREARQASLWQCGEQGQEEVPRAAVRLVGPGRWWWRATWGRLPPEGIWLGPCQGQGL